MFGPDPLFLRMIDERALEAVAAAGYVQYMQVQVVALGSGEDAGKIKVRDPEGGLERDLFYPQTNPAYVPAVDSWMWAVSKRGGLLILSP